MRMAWPLNGEAGVQAVMEYLTLAELDITMALNGLPYISRRIDREQPPGVKRNL